MHRKTEPTFLTLCFLQAFDQNTADGQQADYDAFDNGVLADDCFTHSVFQLPRVFVGTHLAFLRRTSLSGTPTDPDGALIFRYADKVAAISTVYTLRSTVRACSPAPANTIGT